MFVKFVLMLTSTRWPAAGTPPAESRPPALDLRFVIKSTTYSRLGESDVRDVQSKVLVATGHYDNICIMQIAFRPLDGC